MSDWAQVRPVREGAPRRGAWHAVRTFTRGIGMAISLCDRMLFQPYPPEPPTDAKVCKTCKKHLAALL